MTVYFLPPATVMVTESPGLEPRGQVTAISLVPGAPAGGAVGPGVEEEEEFLAAALASRKPCRIMCCNNKPLRVSLQLQ